MEAQNSKKKNKVGFLKLICWQSSAVSVSISTLVLMFVTIYCTAAPAEKTGTWQIGNVWFLHQRSRIYPYVFLRRKSCGSGGGHISYQWRGRAVFDVV